MSTTVPSSQLVFANPQLLSCIFEHIPTESTADFSGKEDLGKIFAKTFLSIREVNRGIYQAARHHEFLVIVAPKVGIEIDDMEEEMEEEMRFFIEKKNPAFNDEQIAGALATKIRYLVEDRIFLINNFNRYIELLRNAYTGISYHPKRELKNIDWIGSYWRSIGGGVLENKICRIGTLDELRFLVYLFDDYNYRHTYHNHYVFLVIQSCIAEPSRQEHLKFILAELKKNKLCLVDFTVANFFSERNVTPAVDGIKLAIRHSLDNVLSDLLKAIVEDMGLEVKYIQKILFYNDVYDSENDIYGYTNIHDCIKSNNRNALEKLLSLLRNPSVGLTSEQQMEILTRKSYAYGRNEINTPLQLAEKKGYVELVDMINSFISNLEVEAVYCDRSLIN